jgi:hypothetical protein
MKWLKVMTGVEAVAGDVKAIRVDVAHPLRPQIVLHRLEEIEERPAPRPRERAR